MKIDDETCYRALVARDARFDGLFFVGVTTTGIYCRPICTARTASPGRAGFSRTRHWRSGRDFGRACGAGLSWLRAMLRWMRFRRTARAAARRIEAGALNDGGDLERLAHDLGTQHAAAAPRGPAASSASRRSSWPRPSACSWPSNCSPSRICRSSRSRSPAGSRACRRFNALFRSHYRLTPTRGCARVDHEPCRRLRPAHAGLSSSPGLARALALPRGRATAGVEAVDGDTYARTAAVGGHRGWLKVKPIAGRNTLSVELATSLMPALPEVLARVKSLFDLSARPDVIASHLADDSRLGRVAARAPDCACPARSTGSSWRCAPSWASASRCRRRRRLAGRLADRFGEPIETPVPGLTRLFPTPARLADVEESELTSLGIAAPRAASIRAIAQAVARRRSTSNQAPTPRP